MDFHIGPPMLNVKYESQKRRKTDQMQTIHSLQSNETRERWIGRMRREIKTPPSITSIWKKLLASIQ